MSLPTDLVLEVAKRGIEERMSDTMKRLVCPSSMGFYK